MILTVKLHGTGTPKDPYRVALPTYQLIHGNITKGTAVVSVPDDVHGLTDDDLKNEEAEQTTDGNHYPKLSDEALDKIHGHFDDAYQEHKGEFRVERV